MQVELIDPIGTRPILTRPREENEFFVSNKVNPKISVITPSLNHGKFMEDTILSVARQKFKDFEHIIMDGGSTDETMEIVSKYPHVTCYSSEDSGPTEAFSKGLDIAKGDYVIMICTSDGLINEDWLGLGVEYLENDSEVSLVWGLPQYLSEDGILGDVSYINYHFASFEPPQKFDWINYWANTKFWFPEGNFIARRKVYRECFPTSDGDKKIEPCLEFNFEFNSRGYLPHFIKTIANFGRTHENQMGQIFASNGLNRIQGERYDNLCNEYIRKIQSGTPHFFRDGESNIIKS